MIYRAKINLKIFCLISVMFLIGFTVDHFAGIEGCQVEPVFAFSGVHGGFDAFQAGIGNWSRREAAVFAGVVWGIDCQVFGSDFSVLRYVK